MAAAKRKLPRPVRPPTGKGWARVGLSPAQIEQAKKEAQKEKAARAARRANQRAARKVEQLRAALAKAQRELAEAKAAARAKASKATKAKGSSAKSTKKANKKPSKAARFLERSTASLRGWVTRRQREFERLRAEAITKLKRSEAMKKVWRERKAREADAMARRPGESKKEWALRIMDMEDVLYERDYPWIAEQTGLSEHEVYTIGVSPGSVGQEVA